MKIMTIKYLALIVILFKTCVIAEEPIEAIIEVAGEKVQKEEMIALPRPISPLDRGGRNKAREKLLADDIHNLLIGIIAFPSLQAPKSVVLIEKNGVYYAVLKIGKLNNGTNNPNDIDINKSQTFIKEIDKKTAISIQNNLLILIRHASYLHQTKPILDNAIFEIYALSNNEEILAAAVTPFSENDFTALAFSSLNELILRSDIPDARKEEIVKTLRRDIIIK